MRKVELLAPAGNYESFLGAIHAGADAVYLGGEKFGARAYADNFSEEEICKAISYAHVFGRKVYLTVNTLIKDSEFPELIPYIKPFYLAGLDGVIVQDLGALLAIREAFPGLELHASTQMTLTGANGAKFLKDLGVVRIVPARELSLQEMVEIKEQTGLEIEAFIHGAMCYCYSGQCLFSSILGGRSGNRGRCAQPCRLPYQTGSNVESAKNGQASKGIRNVKEEYPLSLKDMCTIELLPKLIEAGIDSFKIEGRMKKPEYAAGVTAIYRKYIDLYYEKGAEAYRVSNDDLEQLSALYIRSQIQEGYYFKHNGADMVTLKSPAYNGSDEKLLHFIREKYINSPMKQKVQMQACFKVGEVAKLTISYKDLNSQLQNIQSVTVTGQTVERAAKQPVTEENIKAGLMKLGATPFCANAEDISIVIDGDIFYPLKAINDLRRSAIDALLAKASGYDRASAQCEQQCNELTQKLVPVVQTKKDQFRQAPSSRNYRVLISTIEQLDAFWKADMPVEVLYLESTLFQDNHDIVRVCKEKLNKRCTDAKVYVALPHIIRKRDYRYLAEHPSDFNEADGCLVRNLESLQWLKENNFSKGIATDAGLYCFNKTTLAFWQSNVQSCCLPYELNKKELRILLEGMDEARTEQVAFGRIPLMLTANCVGKTTGKCLKTAVGKNAKEENPEKADHHKNIIFLKDRYQKEFPVYLNCQSCYNIIYNSLPLSLHEKVQSGNYAGAWRLSFTTENAKETAEVLRYFDEIRTGKAQKTLYKEYTLGHEKRGVE